MKPKIINQYYVLSCVFSTAGMAIMSATYVTFLMKNGMDLLQTNLVNTVFYFMLFVCEIPTGAFADTFGRKASFVLACVFMSLGMFVYGYSNSFIGFILAEAISAVGKTFYSGAFKAWLVDSLKHINYKGSIKDIFVRESINNLIGGWCGAVIGTKLAMINLSLPWITGGVIIAILALVANIWMREDYFVRHEFSLKRSLSSMKTIAISSIFYGLKNKAVRFVLLITFFQTMTFQALNMFWQPFFGNYGMSEFHFGWLMVLISASMTAGVYMAKYSKTDGRERMAMIWSQVIVGALIILSVSITSVPIVIVLFLLHEVGRGFSQPLKEVYLQTHIPSSERATIGSFCSTVPHIGGVVGLLGSGWLAKNISISTAWFVSAVVLIVGMILIAMVTRNNNINSN